MAERKLFLASSKNHCQLLEQFTPLGEVHPSRRIIAFIPYVDRQGIFHTADIEKEDGLRFLQDHLGFTINQLNPCKLNPRLFFEELQNTAGLYIYGGDSWQLLHSAQRLQFNQILPEYIANGGCFMGASAGSMLAGISMEPANYHPLETHKDLSPGRRDGLRLIQTIIWPHYHSNHERDIKRMPESLRNRKIIRLRDYQAVIVNGAEIIIVQTTEGKPETPSEPIGLQVRKGLITLQQSRAAGRYADNPTEVKNLILDLTWLNKVLNKGFEPDSRKQAEHFAPQILQKLEKIQGC